MKVNDPKFLISAVSPKQYPDGNLLEVAFCGRSNAGKSTLINALCGRKRIAYSGRTPGVTRQINFYDIDGELMFVDLPGYGYASVSGDQKKVWSDVINDYLNVRPQLYMVLLLLDIRRDPSGDDLTMLEWIKQSGLAYAVVLTKSDKLSAMKVRERTASISACLKGAESGRIIPVSALSRDGIDALWELIEAEFTEEDDGAGNGTGGAPGGPL